MYVNNLFTHSADEVYCNNGDWVIIASVY